MLIRRQTPEDAAAVRDVLSRAFGDTGQVADLAEALAARGDHLDVGLVAEQDGVVIGQVQLSAGWIDAARQLVDVLVLSPLGVEPGRQRSGVGTGLCHAALDHARTHSVPAVYLEGDPRYYARFGWQRGTAHGFTAPSNRIPDPGFQVALLPSWQPWMVGAVIFNDTFWAFDRVGLRNHATASTSSPRPALPQRDRIERQTSAAAAYWHRVARGESE